MPGVTPVGVRPPGDTEIVCQDGTAVVPFEVKTWPLVPAVSAAQDDVSRTRREPFVVPNVSSTSLGETSDGDAEPPVTFAFTVIAGIVAR